MDTPNISEIKQLFNEIAVFFDTGLGKFAAAAGIYGAGYLHHAVKQYFKDKAAHDMIDANTADERDINFSRTFIMPSGQTAPDGRPMYNVMLENAFGHLNAAKEPRITIDDLFGGSDVGRILGNFVIAAGKECLKKGADQTPIVFLNLHKVVPKDRFSSILKRMDAEGRNTLSGLIRGHDLDSFFADERAGLHKTEHLLPVIVQEDWPVQDKLDDSRAGVFSDRHRQQLRVLLIPTWQLEPDNIKNLRETLRFRNETGEFAQTEGHHRHKQRIETMIKIGESWQKPEEKKLLSILLISKTSLAQTQLAATAPQPVQRPA